MSSRAEARTADPLVLLVIALGGGLGALLRYGFSVWLPPRPDSFPTATFAVNVIGCAAMGILMVLITEVWVANRLLRPFFGVGLLGGFTTFSTYSAEIRTLLESGAVGTALGYLGATVVSCLAAVVAGMMLARWVTGSVRITG
ncbi:fluoride efflux transporter CrcB [Nocardia cyriacigeorgica]|uniref:Fluoride-specific ion channel FluC n=1 Tax=Nocardia cyriacigeorgica TaxID=135487 RepID=A0A6P1D5T7_9NOCA|nr:fluoride efflux transporter CrcB [Nocardia cyriacigeorgica]NEW40936.1 fluoride efflux transporter CrcB [Nocardia cyriacigeorgica]NEW44243.1 fluoride efflux transporter CrcB [Nocardia cyriacigeorgica]NEW51258.1 fluoride efflux transporter CrcB [Nocardia cyriacigeorgica]NEW59145.1 fluoride efflux transporter CrcB [Nocardia cyriacigeorgica]